MDGPPLEKYWGGAPWAPRIDASALQSVRTGIISFTRETDAKLQTAAAT